VGTVSRVYAHVLDKLVAVILMIHNHVHPRIVTYAALLKNVVTVICFAANVLAVAIGLMELRTRFQLFKNGSQWTEIMISRWI